MTGGLYTPPSQDKMGPSSPVVSRDRKWMDGNRYIFPDNFSFKWHTVLKHSSDQLCIWIQAHKCIAQWTSVSSEWASARGKNLQVSEIDGKKWY